MKKVWMVSLILAGLLCIAGCTGTSGNDSTSPGSSGSEIIDGPVEVNTFSAGFARGIITPTDPVPMSGFGNVQYRVSTGYLEDLTVSCTAIADGEGNTVLMFTSDLQNSRIEITSEIRRNISEMTGVPEDLILMTATHTHSAVALAQANKNENVAKYVEMYKKKIVEVGMQAMADLKPAEMYWGTADLTGYNFVKHYYTDLGECVGDNHGMWAVGEIVRHTTEANGIMYILKMERESDKDIYLLNWRAHPTLTGGATITDISADFVSPLRDRIEAELDCNVAYYQGEAGNINAKSRIASENVASVGYVKYGEQMGDIVINAVKEGMTHIEYGPIVSIETTFTGKVNHSKDYMYAVANMISTYWSETNDKARTNEMVRENGLESVYEANSIISRSKLGVTYDIEIHATRIGDFAMVHCPNEIFDSLGMIIRNASPTENLFILGYSNEMNFYIPSQEGYEYGCYEADCSYYAPGEGELLAAKLVSLLKELYE